MGILKLNPALSIFLNAYSLGIAVNCQGICWDYLMCFDAIPTPSVQGYYCVLCMPEHRIYYPNRQALWQAEMFEPFLEWLITRLIPAQWLSLYGSNGCTGAELKQQPDEEAKMNLPVWIS